VGWEIDFLAVGKESKGGDAIALRWGNLFGGPAEQTVVVIDGGYKDCGTELANLIHTRYGTNHVDIVISTHPDHDHVTGLETLLEEMSVGQLWMHQPWKHSQTVELARSSAFKSMALDEKVELSLKEASDLETIANRKGIPIVEPFTGTQSPDGALTILGPSIPFYEEQLASIRPTSVLGSLAASLREGLTKAHDLIVHETLTRETLTDGGTTSPQNNSSAIALLQVDGQRLLFTGDAGMPALDPVIDLLHSAGLTAGTLNCVQIPHHGSRKNVGPTVLDRLLNPNPTEDRLGVALLSAPAKNPENRHPSLKVINAFRRRGYHVFGTHGRNMHHSFNAPTRQDYSSMQAHPLYAQVEADSEDQ
jgi:beta-lactamase superfamily II metal-dependent hydrolase